MHVWCADYINYVWEGAEAIRGGEGWLGPKEPQQVGLDSFVLSAPLSLGAP